MHNDLIEWTEINSDDDLKSLMDLSNHFCESVILSINYITSFDRRGRYEEGKVNSLLLTFYSEYIGKTELLFESVQKFAFQAGHECFPDYSGCYLNFHTDLMGKTRDDRLILWADNTGFDPAQYYCEELNLKKRYVSYIIARSLKWRLVKDA